MSRRFARAAHPKPRWWHRRWPVRAVIAAILAILLSAIAPAHAWNNSTTSTELTFVILVGAYLLSFTVPPALAALARRRFGQEHPGHTPNRAGAQGDQQ